jgi:4-carboxymuconolactone decarboxylase
MDYSTGSAWFQKSQQIIKDIAVESKCFFLTCSPCHFIKEDRLDPKEIAKKTGKTAKLYFSTVKEEEKPYNLWKHFDKDLARDMSLYITGQMYSREKIPHQTRQLITVAALTVLSKPDELKLHTHAALNVGCTKEEIAEVIFQTSIYGGVPAANTALTVLKKVLEERGAK